MLGLIKKLLGFGPTINFAELVQQGAQIIDVRSTGEYAGGHIKGSKNIPLDSLRNNLSAIANDKPIITCCASGARSASAKSILQSQGYTNVHNGGGWYGLQSKIK